MAFEVETGTASPTANSLCSVATADARMADLGRSAWAGLDTATKQVHLVRGTTRLIADHGTAFVGELTDQRQAMPWPRITRLTWGLNEIPPAVPFAVCEYAWASSQGDDLQAAEAESQVTSEKVVVGPIEKSVSYGGSGKRASKTYDAARGILAAARLIGGSLGGFLERG